MAPTPRRPAIVLLRILFVTLEITITFTEIEMKAFITYVVIKDLLYSYNNLLVIETLLIFYIRNMDEAILL